MLSPAKTHIIKPMLALRNIFWSALAAWLLSAGRVFADGAGGVPSDVPSVDFILPSPLNVTGGIIGLVQAIINNIVLPLGASVVALAIIYSGFLYIKAQGKPGDITKAHEALTYTLIGAAILLGSWVIANLIGGTINQLRSAVPATSYYVSTMYV